jgi:bifunctional UDP-N-acetylglucosamine pyrophosphorylase / glucosamine-1-phosphate N-acetyltransferase
MDTEQLAMNNEQMTNDKVQCVILAAGQGTRMKSEKPKVLHQIAGKPMVQYAIDAATAIGSRRPIVVIGHGAEQVQNSIGDRVDYVLQVPQRGTGHALLQARDKLDPGCESVLVLYGDTPFLSAETIQRLLAAHHAAQAVLSLVTFTPNDPALYGRIVRDDRGQLLDIVEYKEATPAQRVIREVNSGIFCYQTSWLLEHLDKLQPRAGHGEYYLTDLVNIAASEDAITATCSCDEAEVLGINDRVQLAAAERLMREQINLRHMLNGVTLIDPANTYIEASVTIGADTVIHPGSHLTGKTVIGRDCAIGPHTLIDDSQIGNHVEIVASMIEGSVIEDNVDIGPFSHMRKGTHLGKGVHIGNFAEVKDSTLGPGTKQGHFSYLGNATIGANVNIGAGTITCNYDGQRKHPTTIGDNTFIGSDTMLVAPVNIGHDAKTGAGSVVTHDVADNELVYGVPAKPQVTRKQ